MLSGAAHRSIAQFMCQRDHLGPGPLTIRAPWHPACPAQASSPCADGNSALRKFGSLPNMASSGQKQANGERSGCIISLERLRRPQRSQSQRQIAPTCDGIVHHVLAAMRIWRSGGIVSRFRMLTLKSCHANCGSTIARSSRKSIEFDEQRERAVVQAHRLAIADRMARRVQVARVRKGLVDSSQPSHVHGVAGLFSTAISGSILATSSRYMTPVFQCWRAAHQLRRHAHAVQRLLARIDFGHRPQQSVACLGLAAAISSDVHPQLDQRLDVEQTQPRQTEALRVLAEHGVHQRGVRPRRCEQKQRCGHAVLRRCGLDERHLEALRASPARGRSSRPAEQLAVVAVV